jgi:cytoskeletal protein CcmA (bactofilin family)
MPTPGSADPLVHLVEGSPLTKGIVLLAVALVSLPAAAAQQTELGGKVRSGREVTIPAGETVQGDLVATGGTVRVDGRVDGDLVASAGQVTVAGTVTGDVLVGAGSTTISGDIGGDLRAGTGQARIEGRVGEDVLLGAGQATITSSARIGGDLIFGSGRMQMDGEVAGNVLGSTGDYTKGGSVRGTEKVNVRQPEAAREPTLADRAVDVLRRYVSVLVIGVLLLWLLPRVLRDAADAARRRSLFVLAVVFAAPATVGLALGRLVFRGEGGSFAGWLGALALGVLVVVLLAAIPVVGGWLEALVVLLGLDALLLTARPGRTITPNG